MSFLHFATVLDPPLGRVCYDENLFSLLTGSFQEPVGTLIEFFEDGLGVGANVEELEGTEIGGAEDGVVPVEDED